MVNYNKTKLVKLNGSENSVLIQQLVRMNIEYIEWTGVQGLVARSMAYEELGSMMRNTQTTLFSNTNA